MLHRCRICKKIKHIPPSRVKKHNWICGACTDARNRANNPARYLARKRANGLRCLRRRLADPIKRKKIEAAQRRFDSTPKRKAINKRWLEKPQSREHMKFYHVSYARYRKLRDSSLVL